MIYQCFRIVKLKIVPNLLMDAVVTYSHCDTTKQETKKVQTYKPSFASQYQ